MVDIGLWGGIVPDNAGHHTTLQAMVDAGVLGFKSFMIPSGAAGLLGPCYALICVHRWKSTPFQLLGSGQSASLILPVRHA